MSTPYITPSMLHNAPTGIPWSIIPSPRATLQQQQAEQLNICWRASTEVDQICNQPLRATLDTEEEVGPEYRITVANSGIATMLASRWPVVEIIGGQVSPASAFPPAWTSIPATGFRARPQLLGTYGTSAPGASAAGPAEIDVAPGYVSWWNGRNGNRLQIAYVNGWPHAGITGPATAGQQVLTVDDVTGFAGASAFVYDDANTETVTIASVTATNPVTSMGVSVPVGPGTLTLSAALQYNHAAGVIVSSLPANIGEAAIYLAAAQVLEAGTVSLQMQSTSAGRVSTTGAVSQFRKDAKAILADYARFI